MTAYDMSRLHVLVVEDELVTRTVMTTVLKSIKTGRISTARDGDEALAILDGARRRVDVILLDLTMPRLNGYEFIQKLRKDYKPSISETPVIVISGHSEKKALDRIYGLGIRLFLLKPVTADQVVTRINAAVKQRTK